MVNLTKGRGKKKEYDDPTKYNHRSETLRDGGIVSNVRVQTLIITSVLPQP